MADGINQTVLSALQAKLKEIVDRRVKNEKLREEAAAEALAIDRDLADLRAACRILSVNLPFPEEKKDDERSSTFARLLLSLEKPVRVRTRPAPLAESQEAPNAEGQPTLASVARPPIKEIVLDCLRSAGEKGMSAAEIRRHIDRVYGGDIHEKTVGMTLYRLSRESIVRRDGLTWFLVTPSEAETRNPGVSAPGFN